VTHQVKLPPPIWAELQRRCASPDKNHSSPGPKRWPRILSLRLHDGTVKRWVEINENGEAVAEEYEEYGPRAEHFGPPRFRTEDVHSWGFKERRWKPTLFNWFAFSWSWEVVALAEGSAASAQAPSEA
jgi:hypothetical protein